MFPQVFALYICITEIPTLFLVTFVVVQNNRFAVPQLTFSSLLKNYFFLAAAAPALGLLAPYLERACLLLATPAVSRVPRTM